jgi:hypothetical protein
MLYKSAFLRPNALHNAKEIFKTFMLSTNLITNICTAVDETRGKVIFI